MKGRLRLPSFLWRSVVSAASLPLTERLLPTTTRTRGATKPAASPEPASGKAASKLIDERIRELGDWRGDTLARMRKLILEADPAIAEEVKWMGTPVWSRDGLICTGESYKGTVKLTFAHGASLPDPKKLFNASLEGNTRRAIDIREGETVAAAPFKALVKAAIERNRLAAKKRK